jgi:hypothetical protein
MFLWVWHLLPVDVATVRCFSKTLLVVVCFVALVYSFGVPFHTF